MDRAKHRPRTWKASGRRRHAPPGWVGEAREREGTETAKALKLANAVKAARSKEALDRASNRDSVKGAQERG